jgi:hypothetical protein
MQILNRLHRQTRNGLGSRKEEYGRHHERRDTYKRNDHSISNGRIHGHYSLPYLTRKF